MKNTKLALTLGGIVVISAFTFGFAACSSSSTDNSGLPGAKADSGATANKDGSTPGTGGETGTTPTGTGTGTGTTPTGTGTGTPPPGSPCAAGEITWACQSPNDCTGGKVCCGFGTVGASGANKDFTGAACVDSADCQGADKLVMCDTDGQCNGGTCTPFKAWGAQVGTCGSITATSGASLHPRDAGAGTGVYCIASQVAADGGTKSGSCASGQTCCLNTSQTSWVGSCK